MARTDTTPPSEITGLQYTATKSSVAFTWTNPTNSDFNHVNVYRNSTLLTSVTSPTASYTDSSVQPSTTYTYKFTTVDTTGNESTGTTVTVVIDNTPPADVANLQYTISNNILSFTWVNPTDSDFLQVCVYLNGNYIAGTSSNSYSYNNYDPSSTYSFKFTTKDNSGNESQGVLVNIDTTPPSEVTNVKSSFTSNSITLTWTNPTDSDYSRTTITRIGMTAYNTYGGTSFTDNTGISAGNNYTYFMYTWDTSGNESSGIQVNVSTVADTTPPSEISNLQHTDSATSESFTWTNPSDSDFSHINVYRNGSLLASPTTTSYIDSTVQSSTTYTYKFTTVDNTGNESLGTTLQVTTLASNANSNVTPSVPTNLFPFNNSAWNQVVFKADLTDSDSTSLTFKVDYSTTSPILSTYTTVTTPVTLPSDGSTVRASITPSGTFTAGQIIYWRAYLTDDSGATSGSTHVYNFTYKPTGGNFSTATQFMQQGGDPTYPGGDTNYPLMIDVSQYQNTVDWNAIKSDGYDYAILRCYGADKTSGGDTQFVTNVANAKSAGIKTGGYFYATPSVPLDLTQAHSQADMFIAKLQDGYGTGQYGDLIPFIDVEDTTGAPTVATGQTTLDLSVSDLLTWINEFRNYFQSQTGRTLGFYSNDNFVHDQRSNFNWDEVADAPLAGTSGNIIIDMPLWIAGWTTYARYQGGVMPVTGGWKSWVGYQHGAMQINGITSTTDTDVSWYTPSILFNSTSSTAPNVTITNVTHYTISNETNFTSTDITFTFDEDIQAWSVNVNGADQNTGTIADSSGSANGGSSVGTVATITVSALASNTVGSMAGSSTIIVSGTPIIATVDWTELYQEGVNRVNVYGQSTSGVWTTYEG